MCLYRLWIAYLRLFLVVRLQCLLLAVRTYSHDLYARLHRLMVFLRHFTGLDILYYTGW